MESRLLISLLLSFCSSSFSHNVHAVFSFGDSILDAGNNHFKENCTAQADFPPYGSSFFRHPTGRFTNGRTVSDFISQFMGIELQKPYLQAQMEVANGTMKGYPPNGINFASAGSGVLRGTNQDMGVTPIQDQLQQFQKLVEQDQMGKELIQRSFFLLESGSNDIFGYFMPSDPPALTPDAYVQAMLTEVRQFINQIHKLGGRRIAIFSLGPVGCVPARALLPDAPVDRCFGKMNKMVKSYNSGLESIVKNISSQYPRACGAYGAVYDIVQTFRSIPSRYGFTNVSSACCGYGTLGGLSQCGREGYTVCPNPNQFMFWDYFHPSEHTYKLISKILWSGRQSRIRPVNLKTLANVKISRD
ncbi:hypothetical protein NMG60_11018873 [Bertholletia excelsa]